MNVATKRQGIRGYECSGCRRRTGGCAIVRSTWNDLSRVEHPVTLAYEQRRICCRTCGIGTERVAFADPSARITRRFRQVIGLNCQSMATSRAFVPTVSVGVRRGAPRNVFARMGRDEMRPRRRPRHLGADEIHRGRAQKFHAVLSDLIHGEVLGLARDRTEASLTGWLTTCLDARQRAAVVAVCTDMHQPWFRRSRRIRARTAIDLGDDKR
jgi:transposase